MAIELPRIPYKRKANRRFNYVPKYYDPEKERLQAQIDFHKKKSISKNVDNNINDIKQEESLEIDLLTLVKTGLTSQYFETLGAMIALFFVGLGFLNDLEIDYAPAVVDFYDKTDFNVLAISIAIFIVIYIVLMVNLCLTLIKYYGYKALKKLQNLEVKYGLIQTKSILLSPIKVQEFRSTQNWIQKKIKYNYENSRYFTVRQTFGIYDVS